MKDYDWHTPFRVKYFLGNDSCWMYDMGIMGALAAKVNGNAAVGWASHKPTHRLSFNLV
jgi:hypothetical protein